MEGRNREGKNDSVNGKGRKSVVGKGEKTERGRRGETTLKGKS